MIVSVIMHRIPWVLSLWHWLNRLDIVTHVREACRLRRIYGEFAPGSLILVNSGATMYVDSSKHVDSANWRVHFPNILLNQLNIDLVLISHKTVIQEEVLLNTTINK